MYVCLHLCTHACMLTRILHARILNVHMTNCVHGVHSGLQLCIRFNFWTGSLLALAVGLLQETSFRYTGAGADPVANQASEERRCRPASCFNSAPPPSRHWPLAVLDSRLWFRPGPANSKNRAQEGRNRATRAGKTLGFRRASRRSRARIERPR